MLILSRPLSESIVVDRRIVVRILRLAGDIVKLGMAAPAAVLMPRREVHDSLQPNHGAAWIRQRSALPRWQFKNLPQIETPTEPETAT